MKNEDSIYINDKMVYTRPRAKPQLLVCTRRLKIIVAPTLDRLELLVNEFLKETEARSKPLQVIPYGHIQNQGHEKYTAAFMIYDEGFCNE